MSRTRRVYNVVMWSIVLLLLIYNTITHGFEDSLTGILVYIGAAWVATYGFAYLGTWYHKRLSKEPEQSVTPGTKL
ncbi:MAG TPA: hypothetical protein VLW06_08860 [Terriglobales bacterium]|nr:hypothetical protein [Terriglobales bacterium]